MAKIGRLNVQIGVDLNKFRSDMNSAFKTLNSSTAQMKRSLDSLNTGFKVLSASAGMLTAALALGGVSKTVIATADAFNQLQAKVANSVDAATNVDQVMKQILDSSNRTGTAVDTVAQAFARLRPAALELGVTNEQLIQFNETFQKMGILAGATAEEVSHTMIQLSQGISSNRLGGDELRSVLEQMPPVARAIADAMKVPMSQLKDLAKEGKITADVVMKAIMDKTKEVDKQFADLPGSVERSMNRIGNSLQVAIGKINDTSGATVTLSGLLDSLAGTIDALAAPLANTIKFILQMGETSIQMGALVFQGISTAVTGVVTGISKLIGLALQGIENLVNGSAQGINKVIALANKIPGVNIGSMATNWKAPGHNIADMAGRYGMGLTQHNAYKTSQTWQDLMSGKSVFNTSGGPRLGKGSGTKSPFSGDGGGDDKKKKGSKGKKAKDDPDISVAKQLAESLKSIWDKERDAIAEADRFLKKHLITTEQYNDAVTKAHREAKDAFKIEGLKEAMESFRKPMKEFSDNFKTDLGDAFNDPAFQAGLEIREKIRTVTEQLSMEQAKLNDYVAQGIVTQTEADAYMKQFAESLDDSKSKTNEFAVAIGNITAEFGDKFFDTFVNGLKTGKMEFKDFVASALEDLAKLIFKLTVTIPLAEGLTQAMGGGKASSKGGKAVAGVFGKIGGAILSGLGGGGGYNLWDRFASGGTTPANKPFLVGEKGPELMFSSRPNYVMDNQSSMAYAGAGGGSAPVVNQYITINAIDTKNFRDHLHENARDIMNMAVQGVQRQDNRMGRRGPMDTSRG